MTTQISVESISLTVHQNIPVITTELLAQLYGTETNNIKVNFTRNADRFLEGKHFFRVTGDELKNLRVTLSNSQNPVSPKTRSLILWTERGAARHAKMLETDQAWDVFEKLEDCYFRQKTEPQTPYPVIKGDSRTLVIRLDENGCIKYTEKVPDDAQVCTIESFRFWAEQNGWLVMRKEQLVEKLLSL
ncbi:ORF6N domain-containing protein [Cronobacter malonaticus]|nr:ORF6N domain-containing protein [Cronobacter malonaticus]